MTPRRLLTAAAAFSVVAAAALPVTTASAAPASAASPSARSAAAAPAPALSATGRTHRSCAAPTPRHASCFAVLRTDVAGGRALEARTASEARAAVRAAAPAAPLAAPPAGYGPADLRSAYALPAAKDAVPTGPVVAIVDAYDDPTAEADLGVYRAQFGLPPCTTANGCFRKVNQTGGTTYPAVDVGWAQEISLDLDMVSAACPSCRILLVEADSASFADLGAAVRYAAGQKVAAISNSYGGSDLPDSTYGAPYDQPGIAVTASSGDSGYGASFPASSKYVTAVGGTTLTRASTARGWAETAWSGAGSGCSRYNTALAAASRFGTGCSRRAEADVSAVADPNTGVAVYGPTSASTPNGWMVFGGTSASAPIIAAVYALAGHFGPGTGYLNATPYTKYSTSVLNDVTSGSNGTCGRTRQLCTARAGWDGPTGLGTPKGTGAF